MEAAEWTAWELWQGRETNLEKLIKRALLGDHEAVKRPIILDLCGGSGSWSKPYVEAGYDVRLVTLPEHNVLTYQPPEDVHGVLAAPPCTEFSVLNCIAAPRERVTGWDAWGDEV